ncbi:hypothetical protein BDR07DRAFT_1291493 [Suillus spraguei]|nr:hypothetical protein BDR07DRAFT_1291493 [Suillus spraguei]
MSLYSASSSTLLERSKLPPTTNTANTTTSDSLDLKVPLSFTTRTLWSIVSSCILTLFACIYTAIHPNIPSPKDNLLRTLWWQFGLGTMIAALIAPELIVTWAMRQWLSARRVTRHRRSNYTWTQAHSFFVLMGGFMLYVDKKPYHTLQPDELLKLIRDGCIDVPTLTANQIHDKSKNNTISKGLTILQVTWFVLQLITRAIYHLEITQLEVGTLAFSVLSFLTYALWWDKPLNVQYPHPVYWKSTTESRLEDYAPKEYVYASTCIPLLIMSASVFIKVTYPLGLRPCGQSGSRLTNY